MIDDLRSRYHVACLYADYRDQSNQTLAHILGSFLHQLLTTNQEPIPDEVIKKLQDIWSIRRKIETQDILAMLKIRIHQLRCAFICIDAMDELESRVRQQLLNALRELSTTNKIRLFLTGRFHVESEVQKYLQVAQKYTATISARHQDIQEFVREQIMDDLCIDAMNEVLAKDIEDAVIKKSQGM